MRRLPRVFSRLAAALRAWGRGSRVEPDATVSSRPSSNAPHAVACSLLFASSRGGWACPVDANMNIFYSFVNEQFLFNSKKNKNRAMEEENQEWKQC